MDIGLVGRNIEDGSGRTVAGYRCVCIKLKEKAVKDARLRDWESGRIQAGRRTPEFTLNKNRELKYQEGVHILLV